MRWGSGLGLDRAFFLPAPRRSSVVASVLPPSLLPSVVTSGSAFPCFKLLP